jgi:uncharacterized protein YjbJ (UPF0337 family)
MEFDMNIDKIAGEGTELKGRFKESLGNAAGDPGLRRDGVSDQLSGKARKSFGALRDFVHDQPLAAAAIAGVIGFALLQGSRGTSYRRTRS